MLAQVGHLPGEKVGLIGRPGEEKAALDVETNHLKGRKGK